MIKIALTNKNPLATHKKVVIDLSKDQCLLDEKEEMTRLAWLNQGDFHHPLLEEPKPVPTQERFHYEYDDVDIRQRDRKQLKSNGRRLFRMD